MKVLFLTRLFYPHIGGIERHILELNRILIEKGHQIKIITTKYENTLSEVERLENVDVYRFSQPKIKYLGIIYTWFWLFRNRNLIKESDVVHIHDVFIWYWPFRILYPNKKVFITFHGQWGRFPLSKIDIFQKKLAAKYSTGSISIGSYINKFYGIKSNIVSYGAVSKNNGKLIKKDKTILFVGRMDTTISLEKYFKVIEKLKNFKITFCGKGELSGKAEKYGKVLGFTEPEKYYSQSKYFLASGYLTILEALSSKCLVLAAFDNKLQEYYYKYTPFSEFISVSNNTNDLAEKIKYFEKNRKIAKKYKESGYRWAKMQTWDKMADNYLKLWSQSK